MINFLSEQKGRKNKKLAGDIKRSLMKLRGKGKVKY